MADSASSPGEGPSPSALPPSLSQQVSGWAHRLRYDDLPEEVVRDTRLRVLDVIGLVLVGHGTPFGRSVRAAVMQLHAPGPCHILGRREACSVTGAALANGALSQALEYDDTHNLSIVHMSSPAVAAALALAQTRTVPGRDLITAIALGNEISCRIGSISPGQFHRRGFHPTGLFAAFGATWLAGRLLGLSVDEMSRAAGIAGSFAAGLLECWVDGTQSKFLHPGWAAQSGITAATLGGAGVTGPRAVIEGRFGLMQSHLQDATAERHYERVSADLGRHWESQRASFKPFPSAHVIHPYIDALLRLRARHGIAPADVRRIECPVAEYIVGIVCEPLHEKRRPQSDSHGRVSLQYTLAEALARGRIGCDAYGGDALRDPVILALADRVEYRVAPEFPGPEQFRGEVTVELLDGRTFTEVEAHNRGSAANPMSLDDIVAKFDENAAALLSPAQRRRVVEAVLSLDESPDAARIVALAQADA